MTLRASSLLEQLIGAPRTVGEFLPLAIRLTAEVAELHGRGAVHGDLRPANIIIDPATGAISLAGAVGGVLPPHETSLPYMSPEQTGQMNRPIDSRSDLYSLGVVLYQLLAGRLPFEAEDAVGWAHCHVARQPRPLELARPSVPRPLADIVGKLLAKLPDHRYRSALGLRHDLERCLREWTERGAIAAFPLGERDISEQLRIPQALYGRDAEIAALCEAFERVAESGTPELVLVSGYAGIGKSAVVHELLHLVVRRRGRFLSGKFEQHKRDIPYFTISQALRTLALDIVAEGDTAIARWRQRLAQALGPFGKLVVDLVPQLGLIVGPQPAVPELSLTDAETRLRVVFGRLFAACAAPDHPITLFIDDLQWADSASLQLIANLMTDGDARHLLIIAAYRDNEVDPPHPIVRAFEPVRNSGARVRDIVLGPLSERDLDRLVADTVRTTPAEAAPLAGLVREKTGGNPLFAIQFLTALHRNRSIWFDREAYRWRWDVARVRGEGFTDNLADLMRNRLYALPAETQAALQLAACLGGTVDAAVLADASGRDLAPALRPALEQHLLLDTVHAGRRGYRFSHDRIHEAAYALLTEVAHTRLHLEIGRRLLASTPAEELDERVFEIVNQLERGAPLIESPAERERLAELELLAGKRAQSSTAYASALRYFTAGVALLDDSARTRRPELAFELELHRARCEFLTGARDVADQRLAELVGRAASIVDLAAVTSVRIALYTMRDRPDLAIAAALDYLRRVGVDWPAHPSDDEVQREHDRIWQQLGGRAIEELADLPLMTNPEHRATMEVLTQVGPPTLFYDQNLHLLVICRLVNMSLEHGNCDVSCTAYSWLGAILRPRFGNYMAGVRFGQVALELVEQRGLLRWKARAYLHLGVITPWTNHPRVGVAWMRRVFDAAAETGDLTFSAYACGLLVTLLLTAGEPLAAVQREVETALAVARKARFGLVVDVATGQLQLVRSLRGMTRELGSFDDEEFTEPQFEHHLEADPHLGIATCWYWISRLQAHFLAGDHARAVAAAARARPLLWTTQAFLESTKYVFYSALACAAHHDGVPEDQRPGLREAIAAHHAQLVVWAEHCPDSFVSRAALVGAELARVRGEPDQALGLYEQAICAAREHGFVQIEAITYEAAARFHRARRQPLIASAYLREAHACYVRWGAEGKARQLRSAHPRLEPQLCGSPTTPALRPEQLDRLSVIKALQTISSVMDKDQLSRTLLRFVLEEGGARRVVLVIVRDDELEPAAEATVDGAAVLVVDARLPRSLLSYVQRTQEPVLFDATADPGRFGGDPYFAGTRPRAVLCLPVRLRAAVVALLYLENELVPGAFTAERLVALELLAAQAAISLENARLLERERAERIAAETAKHRERLLGEATALMSQSLDHRGVLGALARLCARSFADWAVIDLADRDAMVRIASAHRDPDKEPLLGELATRYPPRLNSAIRVFGDVLRTGEPRELSALTEDQIRAYCVDDQHAELVRQLGTRSVLVVPLCVRDAVIGALTLASATPSRFTRADIELALELGRRMALAIDNARLLDETRRALQLREEFLRIASHEFRTPLTSLRLSTQTLLRAAEQNRAVSPASLDATIRRVLGNTARLEQLTSELLDVTRIEQGCLELSPVEVALDDLVRQAVEQLQPQLAASGSPVSIECNAPAIGRWDRFRIDQVVTNLVTNAAKFGAGKPIELRIAQVGDIAQLTVTDHGIGIDPERLPHVFERFERAVPWSNYGGLGLGLYIARSIVVAHGGTITADSEPGAGSTFTVILPCAARVH